jgi:hypothetical protein
MRYFVQISQHSSAEIVAVWQLEHPEAIRLDRTDSEVGRHTADPDEDILATLQKRNSACKFEELEINPGHYYKGMARPVLGESLGRNQDRSNKTLHSRTSTTGQLHALIQQLEQICRVVHPMDSNLNTFGHEIRNVLILACMEVEAQCKAVLRAHGIDGKNTEDYVKLATPMRLSEFTVECPYYPWMPAMRPFRTWHSGMKSPSQNLAWYNAYNNVKHDRESNFREASLARAFEALAGFFVMLCAQYGWDFALTGDAAARAFFRLTSDPQWKFSEYYTPAYGGTLTAQDYTFSS